MDLLLEHGKHFCILGILHMRYEFHGCCQQNLYHHLNPPNWVSCVLSNLQCGINFWHGLNCWHFCNTRGIVGCCTAAKPQYPLPSAVAGHGRTTVRCFYLSQPMDRSIKGVKWVQMVNSRKVSMKSPHQFV